MSPKDARQVLIKLLPREAVDALTAIYPNVLPENPVSEAHLARLVGQQDVIRFLGRVLTEQEEPKSTQ